MLTVLEVPKGRLVMVVLDGVLVVVRFDRRLCEELDSLADRLMMELLAARVVLAMVPVGVVLELSLVMVELLVGVALIGVEVVVLLGLLLGISELALATQMWFLLWLMPQMIALPLVNLGRRRAPVLRPVRAGVPLRLILMHLLMLRLFRLCRLKSSVRALT